MNILFEYEDKKLILPVNPANVKVTKPSQSQKVEVIGIGEVSVPQTRKLATVSINSFFWYDLFNYELLVKVNSVLTAATSFLLPDTSDEFRYLNHYVKWFEEWQASKKPARWTIVVPPYEPPQCYDFWVTCESFDYEIRSGEEHDYYYNIELLEWRNYGARILSAQTKEDGTTEYQKKSGNRLDNKETPKEITATEKDSIWSVSQQNNNGDWKSLYAENKDTLSQSPNNIDGLNIKTVSEYRESESNWSSIAI